MSTNNSKAIITQANEHILNINRLLKGVKSDVSVDLICSDNKGVIAATPSDLSIVEKYVKLKVLRVPNFLKNTNLCITSDVIEKVIKNTYIFNNIVLVSHLCIIKRFLKLDMTVIWVDIWNSQNSTKVKYLINKCFNISQQIATIRGTNMNSGIPQYPNCWK